MPRKLVSSGSSLEPEIGFSRAVRVGPLVSVSGTAPLGEDGQTTCEGGLYDQTRRCLEIIGIAVREAGASIDNIVRTRVMLTDISSWRRAAQAHGEYFGEIRPACTFVEVSGFIDQEWLVEIEADAYVE